jgi:phosphopantetheinyl transferase
MPLIIYQSNFNDTGRLLIWKASETLEELESRFVFSEHQRMEYEAIPLAKRKQEWLLARILLQIALEGAELRFAPNGKPLLTETHHISISHSGDLAGILVADHNIGLDIQGVDEKLEKIAKKYCHQDELARAGWDANPLEYLTIIWSAKEAVFKFFGEEVHFAKEMVTRPFTTSQEMIELDYQGKHGARTFQLQHFYLTGYHIVFTL